ncbi:TSUP family transporter [Dasania marina]|uniref:TSUP family transporter n=1 Tax=Dasania marina TaxID=471499 RepID=UPI0030D97683
MLGFSYPHELDIIDASWQLLTLLSLVGFLSGFLNAVAGGGGLLTLPVLLWAGLPPLQALATNKCQSVFGTLSSSINFFQKGFINLKLLIPALAITVLFSAVGTWGIQQFSEQTLKQLLPYLLIALALYTWLSPTLGDSDQPAKVSQPRFNLISGCGIGLYGGFFGPGMGAIAALFFTSLLGYNLRKATAHAKPLVLASNLTSLLIFIFNGQVIWLLGLSMAVAQILGARLGSNLVIKKGSRIIKPLLLITTLAIAIKLLWFA